MLLVLISPSSHIRNHDQNHVGWVPLSLEFYLLPPLPDIPAAAAVIPGRLQVDKE